MIDLSTMNAKEYISKHVKATLKILDAHKDADPRKKVYILDGLIAATNKLKNKD